ncbi:MAG: hypothetical protein ACI9R3_001202 [Verrucomicrobiales bacterium]|jgi:hypothetical protein
MAYGQNTQPYRNSLGVSTRRIARLPIAASISQPIFGRSAPMRFILQTWQLSFLILAGWINCLATQAESELKSVAANEKLILPGN